jgi:WD40 repeat protein
VYIFPPNGGEPQFVLGGHNGQVNAVAFSPGSKRLLSASHDGAIRVWDEGHEVMAFDWKIGPVTAVAFSPDGLIAAAAGDKGQVVVWDVDG